MMYGRHLEHPLPKGFEGKDLDDDAEHLDKEHHTEEEEIALSAVHGKHNSDHSTQSDRSGISHKNSGWKPVVP